MEVVVGRHAGEVLCAPVRIEPEGREDSAVFPAALPTSIAAGP